MSRANVFALLALVALAECAPDRRTDEDDDVPSDVDAGCAVVCGDACCNSGSVCEDGACVERCVPSCGARLCGSNGCGGDCGICVAPSACDEAAGRCAVTVTCVNKVFDAEETDVDCGGPACAPCATSSKCGSHADCLSKTCTFGLCRDPSCADALQNGGESDVDCGGPCARKCVDGQACSAGADCASRGCVARVCQPDCARDNGGCDPAARCANGSGGRTCTCSTGYTGSGLTCADVNECRSGNGGCDRNATCQNTSGSFECHCRSGYEGDGRTCADIDECASRNGGCHRDATCTNTPGGRSCACKPGFTGDGSQCVDTCTVSNGGCDAKATCARTATGRTCTCTEGYAGDGLRCGDVDECAVNNGGCGENAVCTNTAGGSSCACRAGFFGDGRTCTALRRSTALEGASPTSLLVRAAAVGADGSDHLIVDRQSASTHELVYLRRPANGAWTSEVLPAPISFSDARLVPVSGGGVEVYSRHYSAAPIRRSWKSGATWSSEDVTVSARGERWRAAWDPHRSEPVVLVPAAGKIARKGATGWAVSALPGGLVTENLGVSNIAFEADGSYRFALADPTVSGVYVTGYQVHSCVVTATQGACEALVRVQFGGAEQAVFSFVGGAPFVAVLGDPYRRTSPVALFTKSGTAWAGTPTSPIAALGTSSLDSLSQALAGDPAAPFALFFVWPSPLVAKWNGTAWLTSRLEAGANREFIYRQDGRNFELAGTATRFIAAFTSTPATGSTGPSRVEVFEGP